MGEWETWKHDGQRRGVQGGHDGQRHTALGGDDNKDKAEGKSKDSDADANTTPQKAPSSFFEDQRRNRGFLFGDDTERVEEPALKVVSKKGRAHRKHASTASTKVAVGEAEDVVLGMDDLKGTGSGST